MKVDILAKVDSFKEVVGSPKGDNLPEEPVKTRGIGKSKGGEAEERSSRGPLRPWPLRRLRSDLPPGREKSPGACRAPAPLVHEMNR